MSEFQNHITMKTKRLFTLLLLLMVFASGCNKSDEPNNGGNNNDTDVRVTTYTPQDITATTAKCGGDVIVTQGLSLTELGVCWSKEQSPTADQFHLSTTVWNEPFVCTITNLDPNTKYYVRAYALRGLEYYYGEEKSFITLDYEYVDLGLPSGVLWATCNIGAKTPEGYGDYFAWGEIEPKCTYNWSTYKHCMGNNNMLTKYCNNSSYGNNGFTDNLTTLLPMDDAATAVWGNGWRTPTKEEWDEMRNNTTNILTTQNGVNGRLYTASNGMSIFLPAAGYRWDDELYGVGNFGYFWSSSLRTDGPGGPSCARSFGFLSGYYPVYGDDRCGGLSVRPVRSAK